MTEKDLPQKHYSRESQRGYINIRQKQNFRTQKVIRDKEGHYIMIKESIHTNKT